jgi:hypothetical protein
MTQLLQRCERLLALEQKLPAFLRGGLQPADANERLQIAWVCQRPHQQRYAAAARFYAEALDASPALAADLGRAYRYHAACCAALAAAGKGQDAARLPEKVRASLRRQALGWLRAEFDARARQLRSWLTREKDQARQALRLWQTNSDLAGLRDQEALAQLPEAEREAWRQLWADLDSLLRKAGKGE